MRSHVVVAILLAGTAALGGIQGEFKPDVVADRSYHGNGVDIEGVGVCDVQPSTVSCWSMDGKIDQALTDRVREHYAGSQGNVSFEYGKKNRFLVVKTSSSSMPTYQNGRYVEYIQAPSSERGTSLQIARLIPGSEEHMAALDAQFTGLPGGASVDIPFSRGNSALLDGVRIEIGPVIETRYTAPMAVNWPRNWSILMSASQSEKVHLLQFEVLDRKGQPIKSLDPDGRPAELPKPQAAVPVRGSKHTIAARATRPFQSFPMVAQRLTDDGAFYLSSGTLPSCIGALRVIPTREFRVRLTGFPLDPAR
jgi:hypothetical protein